MELLEFERLLQKTQDDTASAEEQALVQQCLHESEECRQVHCQLARLESILHTRAQGVQALRSPTPVIPLELIQQSRKTKTIKWIILSSVAALFMIGIFLTFFLSVPPTGLDLKVAPNTVFTLTHKSAELDGMMRMEMGSELTLTSGSVALKFGSGVTSVIEAPASLRLLDRK